MLTAYTHRKGWLGIRDNFNGVEHCVNQDLREKM